MKKDIALKQFNLLKANLASMRLAAEGWNAEWKTLIATILSARTKDETTIKIATQLFNRYPSLKSLADANLSEVKKLIRPINFYLNKSKNIINCSKQLRDNFGGTVPHKIEDLISLSGVGRKTANVFLSEYGKDAIGVDTHVSYISQYLGWTKNSLPQRIEKDLEKLFPKRLWGKINRTLVRFGKSHTSMKEKNLVLDKIKNQRFLIL